MSAVKIYGTLEQGSAEWHAARCGIATASRFKDILTTPQKKGDHWSKTAIGYAYEVAGEILTGESAPFPDTFDMRRGRELEPKVRADYEFATDYEVKQVGFIRSGRAGYSPDGLVGDDGAVEIKTHIPKILVPMILGTETPEQHMAQTQGGLWVSGRAWIDLVGYWPGLPLYVHRVHRDEDYIANLAARVEAFSDLVDQIVDDVRAYGEGRLPIAAE